ncbi:PREDICTED: probable N-acetyltransferase CML3 [Cyprinodon variegatus]|uniref:probable N-acetyltransferase CML3 n=1 Tax=Cyprinodon variegatus TaxID=28743 RepID=UPI00074250AA|nr:PREDICTED: probable N-acetyltransferase CML3 [Cyprinodon variegatus]XP_015249592.1 PREDICTED: probable N-acetyltransferase CML3 [Cyprinodon variegatus]XP_015249593.1 PREDICTED: probable N-acetyltransferase CML3 [Cyprinodon variegatus]XP_015249594.1 PREDICTED: probable N-acetyltransferase CML3 [Cyprinodon variegatus]XP_015249595.1 PREDICTED: probable N-acetyltransferase CML3 [Cyprinodon variegatus]
MQPVIRRYRPSDKDTVRSLFSAGLMEHISPCFQNAMTSPLCFTITLSIGLVSYLLGSLIIALLLLAAWVIFIYCCCHHVYAGYITKRLQTDMQDIVGNYLSGPDDCFWVAEAEVDGAAQVIGMVAVKCITNGNEKYGEMFRMSISPKCRGMGLGRRMTQIVIDFCKERGFSKVLLETSSTQVAAVTLYKKLGFKVFFSHKDAHIPSCLLSLVQVEILKMEKKL